MASADVRFDSAHSAAPPRHLSEATAQPAIAIAATAAFAALIGVLYEPGLRPLLELWNKAPPYSFGYVIPLLCCAVAASTWRRQGGPLRYDVAATDVRAGLPVLVIGLAAHLAASFAGNVPLDLASLILVVRGMLRICGGQRTLRAFEPAVLLSLFMIPVSLEFLPPVVGLFERCTTVAAAALLDLIGIPVFAEGSLIHLPEFSMAVTPATCGLRELEGVSAMCLAAGFILNRGRPFCIAFAVLSLPIAVGVGVVRFTTVGLTYHVRDRAAALATMASFEGWVVIGVAATLVVVVALAAIGVAGFAPRKRMKAS